MNNFFINFSTNKNPFRTSNLFLKFLKKLENVMSAKDINDAIKKANDWLSSK